MTQWQTNEHRPYTSAKTSNQQWDEAKNKEDMLMAEAKIVAVQQKWSVNKRKYIFDRIPWSKGKFTIEEFCKEWETAKFKDYMNNPTDYWQRHWNEDKENGI